MRGGRWRSSLLSREPRAHDAATPATPLSPLALLVLSACGLGRCAPRPLDADATTALYAAPLPPPERPLAVFHLGHSLVGRDMPAMLAELAGAGTATPASSAGAPPCRRTGADAPINGFEAENAHPRFRPAAEAAESGDYDAVVLTEMVEIRDAIRYHDSPDYLARWTRRAQAANPGARVYLYETWHRLDDPEGWLARPTATSPATGRTRSCARRWRPGWSGRST